ncbi:hypothetical protein CNMCM6457_008020 [Aspergillus fumigatiaffinis]|nr:hypothetical protein CNMCM6457_008020 [Aspergillus fumigatiaffinis]
MLPPSAAAFIAAATPALTLGFLELRPRQTMSVYVLHPQSTLTPSLCTSCRPPVVIRASNWLRKLVSRADHAREGATRHFPSAPPALKAGTQSTTASNPKRGWYPSRRHEDQQRDIRTIDFPTILFLDPGLLQHGQVDTVHSTVSVLPHILHLLGDLDEIRFTAGRFFEHVHQWMPFISKKRFYDMYLQPAFQTRPDVVLLLLALKLITTFPPAGARGPRTPLYDAVRRLYVEVEGAFSILVLQAGVLVALYELGHGIYPAAYLSIGACARYAHALGINVSRTVPTRRVLTLVEVEERRRVWWAIVILDRFVSIGCPGRPFATADPRLDDLLPADDAAWDQGTVRPEDLSTLSSPMTGHMSKFALLCQAARLLGQVLHHLGSDVSIHDEVWMQLDRTLQSMLAAALNIDRPDYDQITFVYSALVALYTPWLVPDRAADPHSDRFRRARVVLEQITDRISTNLVERQCFLGRDPEDMSPWGLYFAYRICGAHMRAQRETPHAAAVMQSLREAFSTIKVRWNVAGVYLQLLEAQEAIHLGI